MHVHMNIKILYTLSSFKYEVYLQFSLILCTLKITKSLVTHTSRAS